MLGGEPSPFQQRSTGATTLAVILLIGIVAYWVSPAPASASKGLFICLVPLFGGAGVGWAIARIFRGPTPGPVVDGIAFWVGALVTYPAFRYIHDNTDWAVHPGAGEYSFGQHALAVLIPAGLFVLGQMARCR